MARLQVRVANIDDDPFRILERGEAMHGAARQVQDHLGRGTDVVETLASRTSTACAPTAANDTQTSRGSQRNMPAI